MDREDMKLKAQEALRLSAVAYLKAREKYGDPEATALTKPFLDEYNSITSSAIERSDLPVFLMNSEYMREIQMLCNPGKESCKRNKITDADVRALFGRKQSTSNDDNSEVRADRATNWFASAKSQSEGSLMESYRKVNNASSENDEPPRKVIVKSLQPVSQNVPAAKNLMSQIEASFQRRRSVPKLDVPTIAERVELPKLPTFKSASTEFIIQQNLKSSTNGSSIRPRVGLSRPKPDSVDYKPPFAQAESNTKTATEMEIDEEMKNPILKNVDPKLLEAIKNEIVDNGKKISWSDIAGLTEAKQIIEEAVTTPLLYPELYQGLLSIPKAILLFGPPGTGKTLIGKCIASNAQATFFNISSSALTSKWIGESEKLIKALFAYAKVRQPSIIFIDEIDSILTKRSDTENESSRRLKTEFLVQIDGAKTDDNDRILVVGATNRPQELDDAVRRRFVKRLYIPLPEFEGRYELMKKLLQKNRNTLTDNQIKDISTKTEGYSGADITNLCQDAANYTVRDFAKAPKPQNMKITVDLLRPITYEDFLKSLTKTKATVSPQDLDGFIEWNRCYGSTS